MFEINWNLLKIVSNYKIQLYWRVWLNFKTKNQVSKSSTILKWMISFMIFVLSPTKVLFLFNEKQKKCKHFSIFKSAVVWETDGHISWWDYFAKMFLILSVFLLQILSCVCPYIFCTIFWPDICNNISLYWEMRGTI